MKKFFVLLVSFSLAAGFVHPAPADGEIQQAADTLGVPFADLKQFVQSYQVQEAPSGTVTVTASELIQAYTGNQLQANNAYKGKDLQVTGKVSSVTQDYGGKYYVELEADSFSICSVRVYVKTSELNKIANLQKGQSAAFLGMCSGGNNAYVDITDAAFMR